ncbi:MAG: hypothetical protein A2X08_01570 [Bacteroidetes bacterium GWA2_32_17]|nr:MAG: hypothetical protein A2X08_01570 [Bacteroidetes bacterium GWA2_32_17]
MNKAIKPFFNKTLIITWLLELISAGVYYSFYPKFSFLIILLPVYFFITFFIFHYFLIKVSQKRDAIFISKYMLFTGLKLFINIIVLISIILLYKQFAISNAIGFLICYLVFTVFEVNELLIIFNKK